MKRNKRKDENRIERYDESQSEFGKFIDKEVNRILEDTFRERWKMPKNSNKGD